MTWSNKGAAGNSRCPSSFVRFSFHKVICSGHGRFPAAVPELGRQATSRHNEKTTQKTVNSNWCRW
jgi:hypothetical protein